MEAAVVAPKVALKTHEDVLRLSDILNASVQETLQARRLFVLLLQQFI